MRIDRGAIVIEANLLVYWWSTLAGLQGRAMASAFYPFLFTTNRIPADKREAIINHELIHFAQQKELLIVGSWVLWLIEWFYWRLIKGKTTKQAYLLRCMEQEAYDNMFDPNYLTKRAPFSHLKHYWKSKPVKSDLAEKVL